MWAGPLSDNRVVLALWNKCTLGDNITAWWVDIGLKSTASMIVRDLWEVIIHPWHFNWLMFNLSIKSLRYCNAVMFGLCMQHMYLSDLYIGNLTAYVEPHDCKMYTLTHDEETNYQEIEIV